MFEALEEIEEQVNQLVSEHMTCCNAADLGLDPRAGYRIYVADGMLAVDADTNRILRYYGGFEYIDAQFVKHMGNWVFYIEDDLGRVSDCLQFFSEKDAD